MTIQENIRACPLTNLLWLPAESLDANDYNPNVVMNAELRLLERSILLTGWVQPVLTDTGGTIIDGFHRVMLSRESAALRGVYGGLVPCAQLDVDRPTAMLMTIRMNRAKGSHVALRMSEIIRELVDTHKLLPEQIMPEIGATKDEVHLLYQDGLFKQRNIKEYRYSKAWVPREDGHRGPRKAEA